MTTVGEFPPVQLHPLCTIDDGCFDKYDENDEFELRFHASRFATFDDPDGVAAGWAVEIVQAEMRRILPPYDVHFELPTVGVYADGSPDRVLVPADAAPILAAAMVEQAARINGRTPPAREPSRRGGDRLAVWQTEPCPPWCDERHGDHDHPEDRLHIHDLDGVDRTMSRATRFDDDEWRLTSLDVYVQQRDREIEPHIMLHDASDADAAIPLTISEALDLRDILETAVEVARGHLRPTRSAVSS